MVSAFFARERSSSTAWEEQHEENEEASGSEELTAQASQTLQPEHIEENVEHAPVEKIRSEQGPVLITEP